MKGWIGGGGAQSVFFTKNSSTCPLYTFEIGWAFGGTWARDELVAGETQGSRLMFYVLLNKANV